MNDKVIIQKTELGDLIEMNRSRLTAVIVARASNMLISRMNVDDIIQELYIAVYKRLDYFNDNAEVPVFIKLRSILIQSIIDLERKLRAEKRDVRREIHDNDVSNSDSQIGILNQLVDSITTPSKKVMRAERAVLLRQILEGMSEQEREIIQLRHFEQLDTQECAVVLNITPQAVSMRYFRAIKHLKEKLENLTEFQP